MCGVIGMVADGPVNQELYEGLTVLQHRGQDAAGIITYDNGQLNLRKSNGLVRDVFRTRHMLRLTGTMGIGHVRYPTAGCESSAEAQPFYVNSPYGIALAHNGNLTNAEALKEELFRTDRRHINTNSDSEILLNVFAHELGARNRLQLTPADLFAAVRAVHRRCHGAYAAAVMINGHGILAFRDPYGIRPLCYGERVNQQGKREYLVASESVAMDMLGFDLVREIAPGEAIFFSGDGELHTEQCAESPTYSPCIFEFVYLSRPDSIVDGVAVHKARLRMGERLAAKIRREWPQLDIDVIIPIPDTSRTVAMQLAYELGVECREGFIKNRYVGRTFIMPGQTARKKSVRQKLNPIPLEFADKRVMLVDDSVVRGTTSQQLVQLARDSGAREVFFASAAPPVRYPNVYGIDMPAAEELLAHQRDEQQICAAIGADHMIYQDLEDLKMAVAAGNPQIERFDCSCFDGDYVTGDISAEFLQGLSASRSDAAKAERAQRYKDLETVDVHNHA
ncbi:amidophosphoribosyltransferase [Halorhodospira abdelmalekii]|uniref:amidophosphoribosyltransferase n=1 Tax=Halorhodospira abdelmalekii TaxID=421629 RepID=UPI001907E18A|nr:amidophosphoribosyltransferase [Halorhodospira abdelmalekii]MBK1734286.1 amidophosphoribosyltransferase [Halorhodospira abdelmalekii]